MSAPLPGVRDVAESLLPPLFGLVLSDVGVVRMASCVQGGYSIGGKKLAILSSSPARFS